MNGFGGGFQLRSKGLETGGTRGNRREPLLIFSLALILDIFIIDIE